jgi:hypothetical protein
MNVPLSAAMMTDGGIARFGLWSIRPRGSKRDSVSVIVPSTGLRRPDAARDRADRRDRIEFGISSTS